MILKIQEYLDREKMKQTKAVNNVLKKLPRYLNNQIISEINLKLIQRLDFFTQNFSHQTVSKIAEIAKEEIYVTNDIIVDSNSK